MTRPDTHVGGDKAPLATWVILWVVAVICLLPAAWLVISSFRPTIELARFDFRNIGWTLENYRIAFGQTETLRWMLNSAIVSLGATALGISFGALSAYSFAQHIFAGRHFLFLLILMAIALPEYVTLIPTFVIARTLGILDTYWSVILPLAPHGLTVFLLRQYFRQIPADLIDAARVDGASEFRVFFQVALPLVRPGLGAATLLLFLSTWNAFLLPLVMLRSPELFTMPVGLSMLYADLENNAPVYDPWAPILASTVISILPLAACLVLMQRQFVAGMTAGAVK
ncbi:MAG: carbohydrate ABC transporter permease [Alphaproteobacteria bacterium]|nr:carbohydrate ABC transporter permease [Alphaproteobacteria bacterium]